MDNVTPEARAEMHVFLHTFADELIDRIAIMLTTDAAYNALQGLERDQWNTLVRKILIGSVGRAN